MNFLKKLTPFTLPFLLVACGEDDIAEFSVQAPDVYEFTSLTNSSEPSSVNYNEATTRLVLIKELEYLIGSDYLQHVGHTSGKEAVLELLNTIYQGGTKTGVTSLINSNIYDRYDPDNQEESSTTAIKSIVLKDGHSLLQHSFSELAPDINLQDIMPGRETPLLYQEDSKAIFVGWNYREKSADEIPDYLIQTWFTAIAQLAADSTLEDNADLSTKHYSHLDLKQLVTTFLMGSIPYLQSASIHLNETAGLTADNSSGTTASYTNLQHQWDMAFGYFGSPKHANLLEITQLKDTTYFDVNSDQKIDLNGEYNFYFSVNAAIRDADATLFDTRFHRNIQSGFLKGRALIDYQIDNSSFEFNTLKNELLHITNTTLDNWDASIAAKMIHHINNIGAIAPDWELSALHNNSYIYHWSELKALALILQFNPHSKIDLETLKKIHSDIANQPDKSNLLNAFLKKMFRLRAALATTYSFSQEDIEFW
jgi:hypothetical protein